MSHVGGIDCFYKAIRQNLLTNTAKVLIEITNTNPNPNANPNPNLTLNKP